jgi:uncharacterized protein YjiS (DUF1127 family)
MIEIANDHRNSRVESDLHCDRHSPPASLVVGVAFNALSTVRTWRERARFRRELAARSSSELQDIGVCQADIANEISKPFWRA